jgi:hypothetical protein
MFHLNKKNLIYVFLSVVIVLVLVAGSVSNTNGFYDSHGVEGFGGPFQTFLVDLFLKYLLIPTLILVAIGFGISYFVNRSMKSANAALVKSANAALVPNR